MKQRNNWRIATIALILFNLILSGILLFQSIEQRKIMDFGTLQIQKGDFDRISEEMKGFKMFRICDIVKDECIIVNNLD